MVVAATKPADTIQPVPKVRIVFTALMLVMLLASLALTSGLILDNVTRGRQEMKRLFYLGIEGIRRDPKG